MRCPGQDSRFWGQEAIFETPCPQCGAMVEFFKDEPSRKCSRCGFRFVNPKMDFGCATYCRFAEECLGVLSKELVTKRESFLKDRIAIEAKKRFGRNFKALSLAIKAARYAEEIFRQNRLDNPAVIIATYLYKLPREIGGEGSGPEESAEEAKKLLEPLVSKKELIDEVVSLILSQKKSRETLSFAESVFNDAVTLAKFEEDLKSRKNSVPPELLTEEGRNVQKRILKTVS